jgi:hypothetical protein
MPENILLSNIITYGAVCDMENMAIFLKEP